MYASVIIEITAKAVDKTFTYKIPSKYKDLIKIGARVKVPFSTRILEGFVVNITNELNIEYEIKEIIELVDKEPLLNEEMLYLGNEISEKTLCSKISAYQVMLPKALKASNKTKINIKKEKYITLIATKENINNYLKKCRFEKQKLLINKLLENKELKINTVDSTIKTLIKNKIISIEEKEIYRYNYKTTKKDQKVELNKEQQYVIKK